MYFYLFSDNFIYASDGSWSYPPQSSFPVLTSCLVFLFFVFFLIFLSPFLSSWVRLGLPICTWVWCDHWNMTPWGPHPWWKLTPPSPLQLPIASQLGLGLCEYTVHLPRARALTALISCVSDMDNHSCIELMALPALPCPADTVCSKSSQTGFLLCCLWCSLSTEAGGVIKNVSFMIKHPTDSYRHSCSESVHWSMVT